METYILWVSRPADELLPRGIMYSMKIWMYLLMEDQTLKSRVRHQNQRSNHSFDCVLSRPSREARYPHLFPSIFGVSRTHGAKLQCEAEGIQHAAILS
jgi:hypothetical protein